MGPPMRSSIACMRCRRSKIKCDNNADGSRACETCIKSGQECKYPDTVAPPVRRQATVPVKRPDAPDTIKQERDLGPERKRKKLEDISTWLEQRSNSYTDEVLSYNFLRGEIWDQVFVIFRTHFSTELPFLHFPTLKEKINRKQKDTEADRDLNLVLLGILTLTARFHPELPKYVAAIDPSLVGISPGGALRSRPDRERVPSDPNAASDFYARALTTALGMVDTAVAKVTAERIQAYLMLGLHEWTRNEKDSGMAAWMYVGVAIRMAQALRLGHETYEAGAMSQRVSESRSEVQVPDSDIIMLEEMKRRTMFSCLIMDRLLAVGPNRLSAVRSSDLHPIRLPCSEQDFDLANESQAALLHEQDNDGFVARGIKDDSLLGRFVRLVDFWGDITRYSFAGGRRAKGEQQYRPWQNGSMFKRLRQRLGNFYSKLPNTFTLSSKNFYRHDNHPATTGMFVSLHMLGAICQIMIHREYIPFLPILSKRPEGPRDPPLIDSAPPGFWEESAEHVFKAARSIVDLIELSGEKLPHSALVLFAVWNAAFVGLYALYFPHMDTENHMVSREELQALHEGNQDPLQKSGATGLTINTLKKMKTYLPAAEAYIKKFEEVNVFFFQVTNDFHKKAQIEGGGLKQWQEAGGSITSNGNIRSLDSNGKTTFESGDRSRASTQDKASPAGTDTFSSVSAATPRSAPATSFTAINSFHHQHHHHHQQQQQQQHHHQHQGHQQAMAPSDPSLDDGAHAEHRGYLHGLSSVPAPVSSRYPFFQPDNAAAPAQQFIGYDPQNIFDYIKTTGNHRVGERLHDVENFALVDCIDASYPVPMSFSPELQDRNSFHPVMVATEALSYQPS